MHGRICPFIKAIEYHENGTVKRVEYHPLPTYMPAPSLPAPGPYYDRAPPSWLWGPTD